MCTSSRRRSPPGRARVRLRGEQLCLPHGEDGSAGGRPRPDEPALIRVDYCLHVTVKVELLEVPRHVRLRCRLAYNELTADLRVRQPARKQVEHLPLAWRQLIELRWLRRLRGGGANELLHDTPRHR